MEITNEIFFAIALKEVSGIGDITAKEIKAKTGTTEAVFHATKEDLIKLNFREEWICHFLKEKENSLKSAEKIIERCRHHGVKIKVHDSIDFPRRLYYINDAPFLIYYIGNECWDKEYALGIVGTRMPDGYGQKTTCRLVEEMKAYEPVIVSGMALGIDGYAHYAAIKNKLITIGVMGHGLDMVYPASHQKLAKDILDAGGALISEFPPGTQPEPQHFPRRNRIVAGISDALVVVQSRTKGGSMITASIAHSYNKDVFAIPGHIDEPLSEGPNGLIKMNKATLIESGADIAYFMNWKIKYKEKIEKVCKEISFQTSMPVGEEDQVFMNLRFKKRKWLLDEIIQELNMTYSKVAQNITRLELNGYIIRHPGNLLEFL